MFRATHLAALTTATTLLAASAVHAAIDASWTGTTGNWSDATKWSTNPDVPDQIDDIANFNAASATSTLDINSVKLGQLLNTTLTNRIWTISPDVNDYALTMQVSSGSALIQTRGTSSTLTINVDVVTASDLIIRSQGTDNLAPTVNLNGTLTGTGNVTAEVTGGNNATNQINIASINTVGTLTVQGNRVNGDKTVTISNIGSNVTTLTKTGTSRLLLPTANSFAGGTTHQRNLLQVRANGALGSGDVSLTPSANNITNFLPQLEFHSTLTPDVNGIIDVIDDNAILTLQRSKSGSTFYYSTLLFNNSFGGPNGVTEVVGGLVFKDFDGSTLASFDSGIFNRTSLSQSGIDFSQWFSASGNLGSIQIIPEPGTLALATAGLLLMLPRRRRESL